MYHLFFIKQEEDGETGTIVMKNDQSFLKKYKRHVKSLNMSLMGQEDQTLNSENGGKTDGVKELIGAPLDASKVIQSIEELQET